MNSASEKWHEICFLLSGNINATATEKEFENQVVRAIEVLGWREFKGEIARQPTIQIGSQSSIRPDLIIFNQERKALVVIEVKKPAQNIAGDDTIGQLRSYMRQTKSDFGFLISNDLRIYYDGSLNPQSDSLFLEKIPFDKSSPEGSSFVENFSRDSFLRNEYVQYLQRLIKKFSQKRETNKLIDTLLSEATKEKIYQFLEMTYADFGSEIFSDALKQVIIEIKPVQVHEKQKDYPTKRLVRAEPVAKKMIQSEYSSKDFARIPFETNKETRLRHIYTVLYFMKGGHKFPSAVKETMQHFPEVQDYQTISDKCARGFAGNVDTFVQWYESGEILNRLSEKFRLSAHDYEIFQQLLESK